MNITYTHGNKVWRFAAVPNDPAADLDVSRLCVPGAANDVARRVLADYIQMTATGKIIDTGNDDPLAHFVARSVWAVIAPQEPVPVTARWTVPELGEQELFIPCGELPPDASLYTIDEWALEALMSGDESARWRAAEISKSERVHLLALQDEVCFVREVAVRYSTSERVHLLALQDDEPIIRRVAALHSTSERVHLLALQDEDWGVREYAAKASTSERVHLLALKDNSWQIRYVAAKASASEHIHLLAMQEEDWSVREAAARKSTSERVHLLALQDDHYFVRLAVAKTSIFERVHLLALQHDDERVREAAQNNPAFKSKLNRDTCT